MVGYIGGRLRVLHEAGVLIEVGVDSVSGKLNLAMQFEAPFEALALLLSVRGLTGFVYSCICYMNYIVRP